MAQPIRRSQSPESRYIWSSDVQEQGKREFPPEKESWVNKRALPWYLFLLDEDWSYFLSPLTQVPLLSRILFTGMPPNNVSAALLVSLNKLMPKMTHHSNLRERKMVVSREDGADLPFHLQDAEHQSAKSNGHREMTETWAGLSSFQSA